MLFNKDFPGLKTNSVKSVNMLLFVCFPKVMYGLYKRPFKLDFIFFLFSKIKSSSSLFEGFFDSKSVLCLGEMLCWISLLSVVSGQFKVEFLLCCTSKAHTAHSKHENVLHSRKAIQGTITTFLYPLRLKFYPNVRTEVQVIMARLNTLRARIWTEMHQYSLGHSWAGF